MSKKSIFFGIIAISFTQPVLAALTESYICSSCDYNDAKEAVKQFYETPSCSWNNGGGFSYDMTFSCNTSAKDVIIANPLTQTSYKFNVTATNANSYSETLYVNATNTSLTSNEIDALEEFYDIHAEFLLGANTVVNTNNFYSTSTLKSGNVSSTSSSFNRTKFSPLTSSQPADECSSHPSDYMTGPGARTRIHDELAARIAKKIGNTDWADFNEDYDFTTLALNVSKDGGGVSLGWSIENQSVFSTKYYGIGNKLVFAVAYKGESEVGRRRILNLDFTLEQGASRVDGIQYSEFTGGHETDLSGEELSNCLIKNMADMSTEIEINLGDGLGWQKVNVDDYEFPGATQPGGGSCAFTYTTCRTVEGVKECTTSRAILDRC